MSVDRADHVASVQPVAVRIAGRDDCEASQRSPWELSGLIRISEWLGRRRRCPEEGRLPPYAKSRIQRAYSVGTDPKEALRGVPTQGSAKGVGRIELDGAMARLLSAGQRICECATPLGFLHLIGGIARHCQPRYIPYRRTLVNRSFD